MLKKRNHYRALLALKRVPELGLRRIKLLLDALEENDATGVFEMGIPELLKIEGIGEQSANNLINFSDWDLVDRDLDFTERIGANLVSITDDHYPNLLKHIYDPPILLWFKGDSNVLSSDGLAVIGTRNPSKYGVKQAANWTEAIVNAGLTVNSGLAYGIDSVAHHTAVKAGGKTIAVLGSGIDVIYPSRNRRIVSEMLEKGSVILTEYLPGTAPDAVNFPERNRIVSGMSHGVVVIESGIKGGSMITARSALDQNREVFVVPHPLDHATGEGCNYLIRTGQGKLIQTMADILVEISAGTIHGSEIKVNYPKKKWTMMSLDEELTAICKLLEEEELHIDQISGKTGLPTYKILPQLLNLELEGAVKQKAGKYFELC
jgi:DNA processing protein